MLKNFEMKFEGTTREELIFAADEAVKFATRNPSIKGYRKLECNVKTYDGYAKYIRQEASDDKAIYPWAKGKLPSDKWHAEVMKQVSRYDLDSFEVTAEVRFHCKVK